MTKNRLHSHELFEFHHKIKALFKASEENKKKEPSYKDLIKWINDKKIDLQDPAFSIYQITQRILNKNSEKNIKEKGDKKTGKKKHRKSIPHSKKNIPSLGYNDVLAT
jgi:hypothetical protein